MPRLLLLNPNSTAAMTDAMAAAVRPLLAADSRLISCTAESGPVSIEGYYDEAFAVPAMLQKLRQAEPHDAVVIACFDDTGVDAARCISDKPVIGLCQAGCYSASLIANRFSIVTTLSRSIPALEHLVLRYGFERQCQRVRASEIQVLDLEACDDAVFEQLLAECQLALDHDGAEAIVLGCAGMVELKHRLQTQLGVPIVECVSAALQIVDGMSRIGLKNSRAGGYALPRSKIYKGLSANDAPG